MKFTGENRLNAPVEKVWEALLDPSVLVRTIPGCERLEATGENAYAMTITAGVASIKGTYNGTCQLSDLQPHQSLVMNVEAAGAPGTIGAKVDVGFTDNGDGTTTIGYAADAIVGGMVGGVGQRMLASVSKRMAGEFFGQVDAVIAGTALAPDPTGSAGAARLGEAGTASAGTAATGATTGAGTPEGPAVGAVFTAPPKTAAGPDDFLKGVAVGAGLVVVGVVVGGVFGRRG